MSDVSQESMADSYFEDPSGDYYDEGTGKAYSVRSEAPAPAQEPQQPAAQTPPPAQQSQQNVQPAQQSAQQPPAPAPQNDPFGFLQQGEDGTARFDADAALSFLQPKGAQAQPVYEQPPQAAPPPPSAQPERSPLEYMEQNLNRPFEYFEQYTRMGYDANTAMTLAKQQIQADLQAHSYDMRFAELEGKLTAKEQEIQQARETARLEPRAEQNIMATAKNLNMSVDQFNQLMFDRRYGGDVVLNLFGAMNPDKANLAGAQLQQELQSWYVRTMANPAMANTLAELAQARVYKSLMPKIIEHARSTERNVAAQNQRASMAAPNQTNRPGRVQQSQPDAFDRYLSNDRSVPTV